TLLSHVEHTLKRAADGAVAHETLRNEVLSARHEVAALELRCTECEQALVPWRTHWGEAVAALRLPPEATPDEARVVVGRLTELARQESQCARQEVRLKAIRKQTEDFEKRVTELVAELAPDLAGKPEELATALIERHDEMTRTAERRRTLDEQVTKLERDLDEARISLASEHRRLEELLGEV